MTIQEMIGKYTAGESTLEELNKFLKEQDAGYHFDPYKHCLTPEEIMATKAESAETATGFGLLDSGTGTLDKVEVKDGKLLHCDMGESYALVIIGGKTFHVKGDKLVD